MKRSHKTYIPPPAPKLPESMAVLAGGMADDFNNILTVILGACSLIDMDASANSELLRCVSLIRVSAEHAAALADRLALLSGLHSNARHQKLIRPKNNYEIKRQDSDCKKEKLLT